jgi:hypothetical protein
VAFQVSKGKLTTPRLETIYEGLKSRRLAQLNYHNLNLVRRTLLVAMIIFLIDFPLL